MWQGESQVLLVQALFKNKAVHIEDNQVDKIKVMFQDLTKTEVSTNNIDLRLYQRYDTIFVKSKLKNKGFTFKYFLIYFILFVHHYNTAKLLDLFSI